MRKMEMSKCIYKILICIYTQKTYLSLALGHAVEYVGTGGLQYQDVALQVRGRERERKRQGSERFIYIKF